MIDFLCALVSVAGLVVIFGLFVVAALDSSGKPRWRRKRGDDE